MGYRAIADALRQRIDSGELQPGDRIPSENELMAAHGVEQPTARRALDVLKNEGLIVARRGAGTFVREFNPYRRVSPSRLQGGPVWASDDHQRLPTVEDLAISEETAPPHIGHVLSTETVLVRRRKYVVEDRPIQLAETYYPADAVRGSRITAPDTGPGGAYARLAELDLKPVRFREELRSRMPRANETSALRLAQGTPVICITRTACTADDVAIEVNEMTLDASAYILEYNLVAVA
ncbi:GntR family transcriptional regulator [Actinokineospora globicatena]|uniref:GntR family transcriptional regulator n=1 Tax=Actinokineospora globicatena TaxID=103729 RepID=UPI0020A48DB6|nr:GntR family transcriptional regulator [Actinokineospora globicatena]MCP2301368.1 GntR family transcriptional regulator [Actinokineospora globicatena]GLW76993.1 GntR family transcriptional regulator [Actinokineospora globicatena]GLW83827.1 GntR family transcriptional regulator [Actinokineospora globicatena]